MSEKLHPNQNLTLDEAMDEILSLFHQLSREKRDLVLVWLERGMADMSHDISDIQADEIIDVYRQIVNEHQTT